ncbi:amidohydrolase [Myxococcota bacterium]|nr:amidohydrolase [Myxococcota bacterium]
MDDAQNIFKDVRSIDFPIIDADAHVQEPPDLWTSRAPAKLKDRVPRVNHTEQGDFWQFDEGKPPEPVGLTVASGTSYLDFHPFGRKYDEIRPAFWQPGPRLEDMDIDGIYAQVLYPSVTLKGASTYSDDPELQRFCVRAYNEWLSEFCAGSDGRLIPQAIIPTTGLEDAVAELEWAIKNDHRGAVISRMPGGDFDFTDEDDRFFQIASEAGIPLIVHIGSFIRPSVMQDRPSFSFTDLSFLGGVGATKAGSYTIPVTTDLMFSGMFDRFPDIKLALVESNIGWIPTLLEQCDDMFLRYRFFTNAHDKMKGMPSDIFHKHFYATFMVDTVGIQLRDRMNIDHLMWSTDYPHTGSDWPNSRVTIERIFNGVPMTEVKKMLHDNVKSLYRLAEIPEKISG